MSKIFITGSADGLGLITARSLIAQGHQVTLHARNAQRARDALAGAPGAQGCLVGDLSSLQQVKKLAQQANDAGRFDTVVHNAGVGFREPGAHMTDSGTAHVFAVNALAPYVLTALMTRPSRLVYLSSGLHSGGDDALQDVGWTGRRWSGYQAYCDSKLMDVMMAFAIARLWPDVSSSAVNPGWVDTKMGGVSIFSSLFSVEADARLGGGAWTG